MRALACLLISGLVFVCEQVFGAEIQTVSSGNNGFAFSLVKELEKEGLSREQLARIHAPMGLEIGAISPEEIAISVAAEMIAVRRNPQSNWRALSMSIFADESLRALVK